MNTKIKFTYKNVPYVLEYDRDSIRMMEQHGFSLEELRSKPMNNLTLAFKGLFIKNHRKTNDNLVDEIYENFKNKEKLLETILKMIDETYATLFDDDGEDKGNIEWDIA